MSDEFNRRETDRLFGQNKDQYQKIHDNSQAIARLQGELMELKTDLVGVTGANGLRGEFRKYRDESETRDKEVLTLISSVQQKQETNLKWTVGLLFGVPSALFGLTRLMEVL